MLEDQLRESRNALLVLLLFCIPFFVNIGANSLWDGNEGFYAEPPREMIESGNWLVPTYNYVPRFKKPPFTSWIIGTSYKILGVSEFSERLPISFAAVLTILITYWFGRTLNGSGTGLAAAVILATSLKFMVYSRQFAGDIFLTLFVATALACFARSMLETEPRTRRLYTLLAYGAIGLGILDKGLVAVVIPFAVVGIFILLVRHWPDLKLLFNPLGYLLILLIATPWYLLMIYRYGWEFFSVNIMQETVMRYVSNQLGGRAIDFYFGIYFAEAFPWSFFIVPVFGYWIRWLRKEWKRISLVEIRASLHLLPLVWFIFVFIFFSISVGKRAVYIVPLYPAAAILIGYYFTTNLYDTGRKVRLIHKIATLMLSAICLIGSVVLFLAHRKLEYQTRLIYVSISFLILMGIGQLWVILRGRLQRQLGILAVTGLLLIFSLTLLLPSLEYYRPIPRFAQFIQQNAQPSDEVGTFFVDAPSLMFYTRRKIFQCADFKEMLERLDRPNQVYFVTRTDYFDQLQSRTPIPLQIIDSKPLLQLRLENFFGDSSSPTKRLVLVKKRT